MAPLPRLRLLQGSGLAALMTLTLLPAAEAGSRRPEVVAVPSRPAFVQPPGRSEQAARIGEGLAANTLLRTQLPGRMQVKLADGRSFRLGGDALLRLSHEALDLQRGQIIAWVNPLQKGRTAMKVRTRVATASIEGTTVFLEVTDQQVKVFSWEGHVRVTTNDGRRVDLHGGDELLYRDGSWQPARRLSREEARTRLGRSLLLNDFPAPMETMPLIRATLEAATPAPASGSASTPAPAAVSPATPKAP